MDRVTRLIDLLCPWHRNRVLDSRLWDHNTETCPACTTSASPVLLLPNHRTRRCIAIHETGHAIIYLASGCTVDALTIRPDDTGSVEFRADSPQPVGVWAGTAALTRFLGVAPSDADRLDAVATGGIGKPSDADLLRQMDSAGLDIMGARDEADLLVAEHWTAIERVAEALLSAGRLSGAEIADLAGMAGCTR